MKVDVWYDRYTKNWVVQLKDSKGYQVGNAHYVYTKREARDIAKEIRSNLKKGTFAKKVKQPYEMTQTQLKNWEFDVPQGGGSITPKRVLGWKRDEYITLADLAKDKDTFNFKEALGKGQEDNGVPNTMYLIPKIKRGDKITIYRASDTGDIVPGSYVSESLPYVKEHGERAIPNKNWKIYKTEAYPDELMSYYDQHEFIYIPRSVQDYQGKVVRQALLSGQRVPKKVKREYAKHKTGLWRRNGSRIGVVR